MTFGLETERAYCYFGTS